MSRDTADDEDCTTSITGLDQSCLFNWLRESQRLNAKLAKWWILYIIVDGACKIEGKAPWEAKNIILFALQFVRRERARNL